MFTQPQALDTVLNVRESPTSSSLTLTVPLVAVMCRIQPAIGTLYAVATMSSEPILISMAW